MTFRTWPAVVILLLCALTALPAPAQDEGVEPEVPPEGNEPATVTPPDDADDEPVAATSLTQTMQGEGGVAIQTMCTNCNSADLSLGGLGNEHIAMVCDGIPVPAGLAQIYLLSVMPPTVIENVTIEKGAGRARLDGGAVGGEIEIERHEPEPGFQTNVSFDRGSYGWQGARADLSGRAGWFGGSLVGSWGESDKILANDDDTPDQPAFERYSAEGRTTFFVGRSHELHLGGTYYNEHQQEGPAGYEDRFGTWNLENVDFDRVSYDAMYEGTFRDGSRLSLGGSFSERNAEIDETFNGPESEYFPSYIIEDQRRHASGSWSRPFGARAALRIGGSWSRRYMQVVDVRKNLFDVFAGLPFDEVFTRAVSETSYERGAWAEGQLTMGQRIDLVVGLRYVDFAYTDNFEDLPYVQPRVREAWLELPLPEGSRVLPRAALIWKPVDPLSLRFSAGAGFRLPDPAYDEVCCGRRFRGNRGIEIERSRAYGIEATYQPSDRVQLMGSAFLTDFDDLVVQMVTISTQFQPTYQNVNVPQARYLNLGLQLRAELARWISVKASYSWLDAENLTPDGEIPAIINNFSNLPEKVTLYSDTIPYATERGGLFGADLRWRRAGLTASADAQYTGTMLIQSRRPSGITDEILFTPSESFWIYNARAGKTLGAGFTLFAGVDNIGDYVQTDLGNPETDYTWGPLRGRYYYGGVSYGFGR